MVIGRFLGFFGSLFGFLIFNRGRSGFFFGFVDEADHEEDDKSDNEEINKSLDEISVVDGRGFDAFYISGDGEFEVREIETTDEHRDDRHDDIVDERGDDRSESATDDDTDGKVNHRAAINELFKFFNYFRFFFAESFRMFNEISFHRVIIA